MIDAGAVLRERYAREEQAERTLTAVLLLAVLLVSYFAGLWR
jgi:hypothetical protein